MDKHLCDTYPVHDGVKQIDSLLPLLFNVTLECTI